VETATLKKLLPRGIAAHPPPEPAGTRYPAALLSALPDDESYALLGWITEDLLRLPPAGITQTALDAAIVARCAAHCEVDVPPATLAKIAKSKTTEPYLEHLRGTRRQIRLAARGDIAPDEAEVGTGGPVVGHPDMRTATQLFEIKMTGQLKKNWPAFLLQLFAYAALDPTADDVYLVLPLQEIVWHYDVRCWTGRAAYRGALHAAAAVRAATAAPAAALIATYNIGTHIAKARTLRDTVAGLLAPGIPLPRPVQFFLSGPQSSRMALKDDDIAAAAAIATGSIVPPVFFIHSQYLINLATPPTDDQTMHTELLIANLRAAAAIGSRGVVVHVGKYTTQEPATAVAHMRTNLTRAIAAATPACPVILETPAGQGTELLRTYDEFVGFVASFGGPAAEPRLRICVDTCHVFVCSAEPTAPLTYIDRLRAEHPDLLALVHFNDSAAPCGSCADRHAAPGQGHIGLAGMTALAAAAAAADVPMVIE
jgi:deoxyribonuclease-4